MKLAYRFAILLTFSCSFINCRPLLNSHISSFYSLSFNINVSVTGANLYVIGATVCVVCIFYTIVVSEICFPRLQPLNKFATFNIRVESKQSFTQMLGKSLLCSYRWWSSPHWAQMLLEAFKMYSSARIPAGEYNSSSKCLFGFTDDFHIYSKIFFPPFSAWIRRCMSDIHSGVLLLVASPIGHRSMLLIKQWSNDICHCQVWRKQDSKHETFQYTRDDIYVLYE